MFITTLLAFATANENLEYPNIIIPKYKILPDLDTLIAKIGTDVNPKCLTPKQDQDLTLSVTIISSLLTASSGSLRIAAIFKKDDPVVEKQLTEAATIIEQVNVNLVKKIKDIAHKVCGTCDDITAGVKEIIDSLMETMGNISPDWESNPIFVAVKTALDTIMTIVPSFCQFVPPPTKAITFDSFMVDPQCLTPKQDEDLETSVTIMHGVLLVSVGTLNFAAAFQPEPTSTQLKESATIISEFNEKLVTKIHDIAHKECGTCADITAGTQEILDGILDTMGKIPGISGDWEDEPVFRVVKTALDTILTIVPAFCPQPAAQTTQLLAPVF